MWNSSHWTGFSFHDLRCSLVFPNGLVVYISDYLLLWVFNHFRDEALLLLNPYPCLFCVLPSCALPRWSVTPCCFAMPPGLIHTMCAATQLPSTSMVEVCFRRFCLPLQNLAPSVGGLQRQLLALLDLIRLAASCFPLFFAASVILEYTVTGVHGSWCRHPKIKTVFLVDIARNCIL